MRVVHLIMAVRGAVKWVMEAVMAEAVIMMMMVAWNHVLMVDGGSCDDRAFASYDNG